MTRDEMLALPADYRLDALVAEYVMGWEWYSALNNCFLIPPWGHEQLDAFKVHWTKGKQSRSWSTGEMKDCEPAYNIEMVYSAEAGFALSPFSRRDDWAMTVLATFWKFEITGFVDSTEERKGQRLFRVKVWPQEYGGVRGNGMAPTFPLAACRAALLATMEFEK